MVRGSGAEGKPTAIGRELQMELLLLWVGRVAGAAGALLALLAGIVRLSGQFWLGSFQVTTLLQGGMAGMLLGCLCLLAVLTQRSAA